jgi:hypothetical protein
MRIVDRFYGKVSNANSWFRGVFILVPLGLFVIAIDRGASAQNLGSSDSPEEELKQTVTILRAQIEDRTIELSQRESIALELAATLDRAAQNARNPESQRKDLQQAILVLDDFNRKNESHPLRRQFQLQSAVYRWASARSFRRESELAPTRGDLSREAIAELDDALARFRKIPLDSKEVDEAIESNLRFRFAQVLADRAELEVDPVKRSEYESQARELLEKKFTESSIRGFVHLLRGELFRREGRFEAALSELDAAAKDKPSPPERQILSVRLLILSGMKRFDDAIRLIQESHLEESAKRLMSVEVLLAQLAKLPAEADRYPIEARLFEEVGALRKIPGPDARLATLVLARARIEPDPRLGPEPWDVLADAHETAGDPIRASGLEEKAAVRAEDSGHAEKAVAYRLKAGALLFRAGKYLEAEAVLSRVSKSETAETEGARAKANLLRAFALGRAIAANLPGASARSYQDVLEKQVKEFPNDPNTDEARWLLGDLARARGDQARARTLWTSIGIKSPRWLDSRRALAALDRVAIVEAPLGKELSRLRGPFREAADFLDKSIQEAPNESARTELSLDRALLDLSPDVRNADEAREIAERISRSSITENQRFRADLIRSIALAQLGRYVEAELIARHIAESPEHYDPAAFLEAIRLMDRSASISESDLRERRFGLLMRMLISPVLTRDNPSIPAEDLPELSMRMMRALLYLGDDRSAKASMAAWKGTGAVKNWNDRLLRDLSDTYAQLDAHRLAIDVQRLRLKSLSPGSQTWLEAKYSLALAFYRSGKPREAIRIIDATTILHPELGGGELKEKFIRLRQRLGDGPR